MGTDKKLKIILCAVLITLICTLSQSVPLIQAWTSFHKPSERKQELVRLNMQQDMQLPKYFRGNSNLLKKNLLWYYVCMCAIEPISLPTWPTIQRFIVGVSMEIRDRTMTYRSLEELRDIGSGLLRWPGRLERDKKIQSRWIVRWAWEIGAFPANTQTVGSLEIAAFS